MLRESDRRTVGDERDSSSSEEAAPSPFITCWDHGSRNSAEAQAAEAAQANRASAPKRAQQAVLQAGQKMRRALSWDRTLRSRSKPPQSRVDALREERAAPIEAQSRSSHRAVSKRLGDEAIRAMDQALSSSPPSRDAAVDRCRRALRAMSTDTMAVRHVHVALERAECVDLAVPTPDPLRSPPDDLRSPSKLPAAPQS